MNDEPKVTLVSFTRLPLETIYSIWWASKTDNPLITPEDVFKGARDPDDPMGADGLVELFRKVVAQKIPVSESIYFTFMMEHVSVSWREQAVRHRIGHKHDDRIGVDIIPDLADSSWWSQSMRIKNMGEFASRNEYRLADTIKAAGERDPQLVALYHNAMLYVQECYNKLVAAGVPMEDARDLMPLGAHHRISWTMNINSMMHVIGKRSCWILQLGLWGPVIMGMVKEIGNKVHPALFELASPPCMAGNGFKGCQFCHENERRVSGEDHLPVCSLYWKNVLARSVQDAPEVTKARALLCEDFWGRNPWTGELTCPSLNT